jgi:hypothetical protein
MFAKVNKLLLDEHENVHGSEYTCSIDGLFIDLN